MGRPRVLWTHNFDPAQPNSQVYMNTAADGLRALGVEVETAYLGNLRAPLALASARRAIARRSRDFDLVHAQYGSACALATAASDRPKIVSIRGNDWNLHRESFGFFYIHTRLARAMTRASLGAYDGIVAVSDRLASDMKRLRRRARIATLPSPVDLTRFVVRDRLQARRELGLGDDGKKWILFTALKPDDPIKRFPLAQEAFEHARARRGDVVLRVASTLPHDRVPLLVAACDVILCTSETEGWPNSIKEALACGVPFVSTDVSDLAAIAAAEASCRVSPADARALADNICSVLDLDPLPADLRRHVESMDVAPSSRRLLAFYDAVLGATAAAATVH